MIKNKRFIIVLLILTATFFTKGCTEDPSSIGIDILPEGEIVYVGVHIDSIKIWNLESNRLRTDGPTENSFGIVGYFRDTRIGGTTIADFFTEVSIPQGLDSFNRHRDVYSVDSLLLSLAYSNNAWYGDTGHIITLKVYELKEPMSFKEKYYQDSSIDHKDVLLSQLEISPRNNLTDSIWSISNFENALRFNFNRDQTLMNTIFNISQSSLENREAFKEVLKGFYITSDIPADNDAITGALFKINLRSTNSFMRLFFTKELRDFLDPTIIYGYEKDSVTFPINRESRMFNRFEHEYDANADGGVILNDPTSEKIFLQGMAGSIAKIDFRNLIEAWRDSINNPENNDLHFSFSGITLEFWTNRVLGIAGLFLERQQFLAIYEEDDNGDYIFPTFINKYGNSSPCFYSIGSSGNTDPYSTYNSSLNNFTFRINPEYFNKLVRKDENGNYAEISDLYIRPLSPEFDFRQQIINNQYDPQNPEIGYMPRITVRYIKYR
ncbi:MAG: DUF4270 domain-containing protein [Marinilabiliaceae bacterium]|nr:DUF4270 domain-containing protein [Marinilabiliaceae bacterium]